MPKPRSRRNGRSSRKGGGGGGGGGPSGEDSDDNIFDDAVKIGGKEALIEATGLVNPALPPTIKLASHAYDAYKLGKRLDNISESADSDREKMKLMANELIKFGGNRIIDSAIDRSVSQLMRTPGMLSTATAISRQTKVEQRYVEGFLKSSLKTGLKVYKKKVRRSGVVV